MRKLTVHFGMIVASMEEKEFGAYRHYLDRGRFAETVTETPRWPSYAGFAG